jgi:ABC-2 type transport system permease protein
VDNRPGGPGPALTGAAGQHALFAIGAGGAGPVAAILAAAGTAGEFRHRTAAATFLAEPRRVRVITAKLIVYLLAGAAYALACVAVSLAVALPWLAARGTPVSLAAHGNAAVLGAVIISAALFGMTGAGLGALLGSEVITIAGLLLYLYVAEPLLSRISALGSWTAYLPGTAADGLTQASQAGVRLLPPWPGAWSSRPGPPSSPAPAPPSPPAGTSPETRHPAPRRAAKAAMANTAPRSGALAVSLLSGPGALSSDRLNI